MKHKCFIRHIVQDDSIHLFKRLIDLNRRFQIFEEKKMIPSKPYFTDNINFSLHDQNSS